MPVKMEQPTILIRLEVPLNIITAQLMDQLPTHYHAIKVALLVELHGEKNVPLLLP